MKKWITLMLTIGVVLTIGITYIQSRPYFPDPEKGKSFSASSEEEVVYVAEKRETASYLYGVNKKDKLEGFAVIDKESGNIEAVLTTEQIIIICEGEGTFQIKCYDKDMHIINEVNTNISNGYQVSSFLIEQEKYYLTVISKDTSEAEVYTWNRTDMEQKSLEAEKLLMVNAPQGRKILQAAWQLERLYYELDTGVIFEDSGTKSIETDEKNISYFVHQEQLRQRTEGFQFPVMRLYLVAETILLKNILWFCIFEILAFFFLFALVKSTSSTWYLFGVFELSLLLITLEGYFFLWKHQKEMPDELVILLLNFIAGTVIAAFVSRYTGRFIRNIACAAGALAEGERIGKRPEIRTKDMQMIWNSLMTVSHNVERSQNEKYRLYETCSRFFPEHAGDMLKKKSIAEVQPGDCVHKKGILGILWMEEETQLDIEERKKQISAEFQVIDEISSEEKMIVLSQRGDYMQRIFFFPGGSKDAVRIGTEMMRNFGDRNLLKKRNGSLFLHEAEFSYSIEGTIRKMFPVVLSAELDSLKSYFDKFHHAGVRFGVTEQIAKQMPERTAYRSIGSVLYQNREIRMLEILDVYSEQERARRMRANGDFQEALKLYAKGEAYRARDLFTLVLRISPEDGISKLYLFACEQKIEQQRKKEKISDHAAGGTQDDTEIHKGNGNGN